MAQAPPRSSPFVFGQDVPQRVHEDENYQARSGYPPPNSFQPPSQAMHQNGSVQMPSGPSSNLPAPTRHRSTLSMGAFEGSRSPPNPKSTSHVPCKFYRLGQCQAGKACPFSHALDTTGDEVCKYFQKGNCKFGQKCALAHILPNGRRVNRPNAPTRGSMDFTGRLDPQLYSQQDYITSQALIAQQADGGPMPFAQQMLPFPEHDRPFPGQGNRPLDGIPTIDTEYAPPHFGSPPESSRLNASNAGHLRTLDAPLPASFDSQGISYIARHGPVAASLPTNLGPELSSPPSTFSRLPAPLDGKATLQRSLAAPGDPRSRAPELGSSPLTSGDEGPPFRGMHSQRVPKPRVLSASLPRTGMHTGDWEDGLYFSEGEEADFIPPSLHDQILTPQERMRRSSRNEQDNRSVRESLSGIGTPGDSTSKVGSPNTGSPASRYGAFFARRQQDANSNPTGSPGFGPVGSPLRNLHPGASPSLRATKDVGESSPSFPSFASPPRHSSMSILSQQLSRTRLSAKSGDGADKTTTTLHPNSARQVSGTAPTFGRTTSSTNKDRIEEEQGEGVFPLDEDVDQRSKRNSGGHSTSNNNIWGVGGMRKSSDIT